MPDVDRFHAFTEHAPLREPQHLHAQGPLGGCTLAVKDLFDVAGTRTGCGLPAKLAEAKTAERTASAVQAMLEAGASFVGKTQCDELCFSLLGNNGFYPRVINPAAPERFSGGSSSGSAAAVAGGLADIATASDTGGSVRAPASFCGLIGLRTTQGAIPLDETMPLAPSLDTFGWFARNADIYAKVGAVLLPESPHRFARLFRVEELDGLTTVNSADAYAAILRTVENRLGPVKATELTTLSVDDRYWCFRAIQAHEAWAEHGAWLLDPEHKASGPVRDRFEFGRSVSGDAYRSETEKRARFSSELEDLLGDDGLLVLPTVPGAAPLADSDAEAQQAYRERALKLLCLAGLSGFPQITLPIGEVDGAPFGISLLGPANSDIALIRLGRKLLQAAGKA